MFNFLIVRVLESNSFTLPNTIIYGDVELRPASVDSDKELSALKESADDHRLQFDTLMRQGFVRLFPLKQC